MGEGAPHLETVLTLERALERVGFGLYSYMLITLTGLIIISFSCVVFSNSVIIPISACDLNTTTAQQGLLAALPSIGTIIGGVFWGYLADTRGRRAMLLMSLMMGAVTNAIASLSVNWIMLLCIQFIASILVAGQFPISMTLLSECVPLERRNLVVILVTSIFLVSQGLMAVMAMPVVPVSQQPRSPSDTAFRWTPWRDITLIYSFPSLLSFIWMFYMQESPKYVFAKGEEIKALQILNTIHGINHRKSRKNLEVTGLLNSSVAGKPGLTRITSSGYKIKRLFRRPLLKRLVVITTLFLFQLVWPFKIWLPTITNQLVSILKAGKGSNLTLCRIIYLSLQEPKDTTCTLDVTSLTIVLVFCTFQSVVNILLSPLVNRVGRRYMVMVTTFLCGSSGILVNLVPNAYGSVSLFAIQLTGMIVMGYYTAIAVSLFPTQSRAIAVTIAVTGGRISTFASIQILKFLLSNYCEVGFFIYSTIFASSSLVASILPPDQPTATTRRQSPTLRITNAKETTSPKSLMKER